MVLLVTAGTRRPPRGGVLVARQLGHGLLSNRQLHDVIRMRGIFEVTMEPPLIEG